MFLKRLLRSSGSKLGNEAAISRRWYKPRTGFVGNWHARTSKKEGVSRWMGFIWERSKNEVR